MKYYVRTTLERQLDSSYSQIEYELLVDYEHKPVESFFKQLELISNEDSVLIEDDCILCKDFKNKIEEIISEHKDTIINFFFKPYDYFTSHYVKEFSWNQCTYYPKGTGKIISDFVKNYLDKHPNASNYQYDRLEGIAIQKLDLIVYVPRPCIVQHIDYSSLIQTNGISQRRTPFYVDYLIELGISYEEAYKQENLNILNNMRNAHFAKKKE